MAGIENIGEKMGNWGEGGGVNLRDFVVALGKQ